MQRSCTLTRKEKRPHSNAHNATRLYHHLCGDVEIGTVRDQMSAVLVFPFVSFLVVRMTCCPQKNKKSGEGRGTVWYSSQKSSTIYVKHQNAKTEGEEGGEGER